MDSLKYLHNGKNDWGSSDDINAALRQKVVSALYKEYSQDHKAIIRFLTIEEIQYCRVETMMTDVLRQLTFVLYDLADIEDVPLLYEAKLNTSFDSLCSLDIELLIGKEPQKIKDYFLLNKHPIYDITQYIIDNENNEVESPTDFIKNIRRRYLN